MPDSITDSTISTVSASSSDSAHEETSGLKELLENLNLSDVPDGKIVWKRKTVEETVTITTPPASAKKSSQHRGHARGIHGQSNLAPSTSSEVASSASQKARVKQPPVTPVTHHDPYTSNPLVPSPGNIKPPPPGNTPDGFWVVTVGQEVGVFFHWPDVALRTNYVSGSVQKRYPSFAKALQVYTERYQQGTLRATPFPGGPFCQWGPRTRAASLPSPTTSEDELWEQLDRD